MKAPIALSLAVFVLATASWAAAEQDLKADSVKGVWWSPKKDSKITIYRRDDLYYGRIIWVIPERANQKDDKNPDTGLRGRRIRGLEIFRGFKFDGKETWTGGFIYDPKSGNTYHASLQLKGSDRLRATGYVFIFSRSEWFERVK